MEHRYSKRVPFVVDAIVRPLDKPEFQCKTKDLCYDGICLAKAEIDLPLHSVVDIELILSVPETRHLHMHALLIHCDEDGIGFMFTHLDDETQQFIDRLVEQ